MEFPFKNKIGLEKKINSDSKEKNEICNLKKFIIYKKQNIHLNLSLRLYTKKPGVNLKRLLRVGVFDIKGEKGAEVWI
ncbi:MAG: hypothetical protein V5A68_08255 [Candidatus Thermoplasmatota archaeon]